MSGTLLFTILILALVAVIAFWLVDNTGVPYPINMIIKCIVGFGILFYLLRITGVFVG